MAIAGAFALMTGGPALAGCTASAGTVTCTGDLSAGVSDTTAGDTLDVNNLTGDIAPAAGVSGISFSANGPVTIDSDTGAFMIHVSGQSGGVPADGIFAHSASWQTVDIDHTGAIQSDNGYGIYASSQGEIDVTANGAIKAQLDGVHLEGFSNGPVNLNGTGNITSTAGYGVYAAGQGPIASTTVGTIHSALDGLHLTGFSANDVTISHQGDIVSVDGDGIYASTQGNVNVSIDGDIDAGQTGIYAYSHSAAFTSSGDPFMGVVSLDHTGSIVADHGPGIDAEGSNSSVSVTNSGNITASNDGDTAVLGDGIYARNTDAQPVSVDQTGTIYASGRGIYAYSSSGAVSVTGTGTIHAAGVGVTAESHGNTVSVVQSGDIVSTGDKGIVLTAPAAGATLTGTGSISAFGDAITATSTGPSAPTVINRTGNVSSTTGEGIIAYASSGDIYLTDVGAVSAHGTAIDVNSRGARSTAAMWQSGNVTSATGDGISADTAQGPLSVNVWGNVTANSGDYGVYANNNGLGDIGVAINGIVEAHNGIGIYALSPNGGVAVTANGDVSAKGDGIYAANSGSGTEISVKAVGNVTSTTADGIYAGYGPAGNTASNASVETKGDITGAASGVHLSGTGNLTLTNDSGTIEGNTAPTVFFEGGADNQLTNYGTIENSNGIGGAAVTAQLSNTNIFNYGTIIGNVALSPWTNGFVNETGGRFDMGKTVDLGNQGNLLYNYGAISPGGVGTVSTTTLNGSFNNEAGNGSQPGGTIVADVSLVDHTADKLVVSGQALLDGSLKLHFTSFDYTKTPSFTLLTANGYINSEGLQVTSNPIVEADVTYPTNKEAQVNIEGYTFAPAGLTGNAGTISQAFRGAATHSAALAPLEMGLVNLGSIGEVQDAYNQLAPKVYLSNSGSSFSNLGSFTDNLFSCRVADGAYYFAAEGQCAWARTDLGKLTRNEGGGSDFATSTYDIEGGVQYKLAPDWRLDTGFGMENAVTQASDGANSAGTTVQAGTTLKFVPGPFLFAASLSGSYGWFDSERPISFGGFTDNLRGGNGVGTLNGRLRTAYTFQHGDFYLKPQLDLDAGLIDSTALTETGGVASLNIDGANQLALSVSPSLEVGGQMVLDDDSIFRPYLRGGVTVNANPTSSIEASFKAPGASGDPFTITSSSDRVLWNASAGIDLLRTEGETVRAYYDASFGQTTNAQTAGLKLSVSF